MPDWRPGAALHCLRERALLLREIREFFWQRDVLEVETPLLAACGATDPHLHSFAVPLSPGCEAWLQTSPEFAMKRLLAAGSGPIYQLARAFRQDESGRLHNREFTLLEWYRPGFDDLQLMDEVQALLQHCLPPGALTAAVPRLRYATLFQQVLALDPHRATAAELAACANSRLDLGAMQGSKDDWLQLLFTHCIEPALPPACFVTEFPASQAALARLQEDAEGNLVARRFELYLQGIELANGYLELTDAQEQRRRFLADNALRRDMGLPVMPLDERLLAALADGMPAAAGVALGVDRLLMLRCGVTDIAAVMAFVADAS